MKSSRNIIDNTTFMNMRKSVMTNILLLHEGEQPTLEEIYRSFQYLVRTRDVSVEKVNASRCNKNVLQKADVIICVRGQSPISYAILKIAAKSKIKIFYYLDDDLKDMPKGSFWYPERKKWLLKCIGLCEGLMTPNPLIADEYMDYLNCRRAIVINTAVKPEAIQKSRKLGANVKIVMAASEWHTVNFEKYVKPAYIQLEKKYHNQLEFWFVGLHPDMREITDQQMVHYVPSMNLEAYVLFMTENKFDIGIAVLNPDHFNERKYYNKFIEYTRYGICGIYSKCMPYELVIQDRSNGFFTNNTSEEWYTTLCDAIDYADLRQQCINNAQEYLRTNHKEEYIFEQLIADCPELVTYSINNETSFTISKVLPWKFRQLIFRTCETIFLTFSSLSHFGIGITIQKMKRKIGVGGGRG